ncbi:hypothetical protein V5799_022085 [Amblyomma americanum]|uniref:Uncharacterized protein n=1 Tax=Amblyomma americanum TaxID=6943 RepID=A0AAQ4FN16_AMBAM
MAARPGSAPGAKKAPRSIQIAIEVEPNPDEGNDSDSYSGSSSEDDDYGDTEDAVVITRLVPRGAADRRPPSRRSPNGWSGGRRSGAVSEREVVISISDEHVADGGSRWDGRRTPPPCRVHGGYSVGPAGVPAPRIPRRAHKPTCRRITACTLPMMGPEPMYGKIGSAKGTRMDWKLSPDGTLNITMGPPLEKDEEEKKAKEGAEGEADKEAPKEGEPPKPVGSKMSLARIMTAGFMRPRLPVVFEAVIGPRPGLTPAVLKPSPDQSGSDTQISIVSRVEQCTCPPPLPPPPPPLPPRNEHAHCQELLLELLDRQEQAAVQIPQINLITPPARREPKSPPPKMSPMCTGTRRTAMHIMEVAATADDATLEEDRRRPTPLLHIMEKGNGYD